MIDSIESLAGIEQVSILKKGNTIIQSKPEADPLFLDLLETNQVETWSLSNHLKNGDGTEWIVYRNDKAFLALKSEFQEFVYSVSHDLKAPLRNVSKFAEVLLKKTDQIDERTLKSLEFIQSGVNLMKGQLDGILEYSRVETQGEDLVSNNLSELIEQFESNNSAKIEMFGANITMDADAEIIADRKQLYQLICKLLDNAFVFNRNSPLVNIVGFTDAKYSGFLMQDNGVGIPEERIANLFKIFGKFHHEINHNGLGLGLTIAKRIVDRHKGYITINNSKDGLQVRVGFPIAKSV